MAGINETVPHFALLLNLNQRTVQVTNANAGAHILLGERDQAPALQRGNSAGHLFGASGLDELSHRAIKNTWLESVDAVSHVDQQVNKGSHLANGLGLRQRGLGNNGLHQLSQARKPIAVKATCPLLRLLRILEIREAHPIPGRVTGSVGELSEFSSTCQEFSRLTKPTGQGHQRSLVESRGSLRGLG